MERIAESKQRDTPVQITTSLESWLPAISPGYNWDWPYIQYVRSHLDKVTTGEINRLMIFMPPRHGKSDLATIRYSAYRLIQSPRMRVIIGAYNQTLADRFSRKIRYIVRDRATISTERRAASDWETTKGGGLRAVGVGAGITGQGGNLVIIDDPVKNREEAESVVYRDKVWDWYTNDLYTRLEPNAAMILIMTRWNMDDLAGRILASDDATRWTVLSLPAEAEPGDPLGRNVGEALNPDRYDEVELKSIRIVLGRDYPALYQQRPQPREGGMFKYHWFKIVTAVPSNAKRVRWWDRAATADDGAYTVGALFARANGVWYVEDIKRGQWGFAERDAIIRKTAEQDREKYGHVEQWGAQDPGQAGKVEGAAFITLLAGFDVHIEPESGSKELRATPLASQAEAGNLYILQAPWTQGYIKELCDFPSSKYKDQVDASSGAFSRLTSVSIALPNAQPTMPSKWIQKEPASGFIDSRERLDYNNENGGWKKY